MSIEVPISIGDFIDKLTILEIKSRRIGDPAKRLNVEQERALLRRIWDESGYDAAAVAAAWARLSVVNESLWDIEDRIRDKERRHEFDVGFVELARSVYRTNDERAALKRAINIALGSGLTEEKSYADYRVAT